MAAKSEKTIITASEVANYVVCPEAWRLKFLGLGRKKQTERTQQGQKLRDEWVQKQDLSTKLHYYAKIAYLLLVAVVIVVFFLDRKRIGRTKQAPVKPAVETHAIL